jgi:hypothetical protein
MNYRDFALSKSLKAKPPWTAFLLFTARCPNALFFACLFLKDYFHCDDEK